MKKPIMIIVSCVALLLVGCIQTPLPPEPETVFELDLGQARELSPSRSITHTPGETAWVRAFDSSRSRVAIGPSGTYESTLTWDEVLNKWKGSIDLSAFTGNITFLAVVQQGSDPNYQHVYKGSGTKTITTSNRTETINVTAATSYSIGDIGPGGGYIYHDKGSYTDNWRYLEAAPTDFRYSWQGVPIAEATYIIGQNTDPATTASYVTETDKVGSVLLKSDKSVALYNYQWYWGPPDFAGGNYGTAKDIGSGVANKNLMTADSVSGTTPLIDTSTVRVQTKDNMRRTSQKSLSGVKLYKSDGTTLLATLVAQSINGYADWVVPLKLELDGIYTMYNGLTETQKTASGFASDLYWSSTEFIGSWVSGTTYDGVDAGATFSLSDPKSIPVTTTAGSGNVPPSYTLYADDLYSWAKNFSDGTASLKWRNVLARVRPSRRF